LTHFKRDTHKVRGNSGIVPGTNVELRVGGLRTNLKIGIAESVADSVNTNVITSLQEVHAIKVSSTSGVELGPFAILIFREEGRRVLHRLLGATGRKAHAVSTTHTGNLRRLFVSAERVRWLDHGSVLDCVLSLLGKGSTLLLSHTAHEIRHNTPILRIGSEGDQNDNNKSEDYPRLLDEFLETLQ
jgi:hypothetical protein